jgi:GGDEF domain-containing protein
VPNGDKKSTTSPFIKLPCFIETLIYRNSNFLESGGCLKTSSRNNLPDAIEFSNNGVSDSLTGAPAPKTFFDNLAREISQSRRNSQSIAIVTIKLLQKNEEAAQPNNLKSSNLLFEKQLALLSNTIKTNMRGGDFYSRMAENGFWLCLQGNLGEANSTAERFKAKISDKLNQLNVEAQLEFAASEWKPNLDSNSWIEEIDKKYFSSQKQKPLL